jgi:tight adherence protein C
MYEWIWLGALFLIVAGVCFVGLYGATRRREQLEARLPDSDGPATDSISDPEMILGDLTPALAGGVSADSGSRTELMQDLRDAGFYSRTALMEYTAVRALLILLPLVIAAAVALFIDAGYLPVVAFAALAGAALGYSVPRIYLHYRKAWRARQIERGLPVAVDLLALALSGGQNVLAAFKRVSRELRFSYPVLSEELQIVASQADLRSLQHALQELSNRVRVPEVRTLALILTQSERLGTDVSAALLEFASNLRLTLKQRAEAQANRASFWMVFPTLFCMWIPAAVLLIGPVFFEFWHRRQENKETLSHRKTVQEAIDSLKKKFKRPPRGVNPGTEAVP